MKLFKQSFLFIVAFLLVINCNFSQTQKEVIQKYLEATNKFKNYHIVYQRDFKYQSSDDTNSITVDGVYGTILGIPMVANIHIKDTAYQNYLMTYNGKYLARLWLDAGTYFIDTFKKDKYGYQSTQNDKQFGAFNYRKNYLMEAAFNDSDKDYFCFIFKDSSVSLNMTIISKEILYVSRTTYLPMKQIAWSWFEGGVQYKKIVVEKIENLEHVTLKKITKQSDSLIKVIRTYKNLDSINSAKRIVYKDLKVGDTLKNFLGYLHGTTDSLYFKQIKDSIVMLDFSYTTCGPCSAAVPHLINLNNTYKTKGVKLFAVNPYQSDWPRLDKYIAYHHIDYSILKINHTVSVEFGIRAYPTFIILKNGIIKSIHIGYSEKMEKEISNELDALL